MGDQLTMTEHSTDFLTLITASVKQGSFITLTKVKESGQCMHDFQLGN